MLFEGLQKFGFRVKAHRLETEGIVAETRSGRLNVVIEDADLRVELGAVTGDSRVKIEMTDADGTVCVEPGNFTGSGVERG